MTKAHITTKSGSTIVVEGTSAEVATVIAQLKGVSPEIPKRKKKVGEEKTSKPTLGSLISELIDGGFLKKPKGLGEIKSALEEQGHYYPVTTLSPALLRLIRRRELRRVKDDKRWLYVG